MLSLNSRYVGTIRDVLYFYYVILFSFVLKRLGSIGSVIYYFFFVKINYLFINIYCKISASLRPSCPNFLLRHGVGLNPDWAIDNNYFVVDPSNEYRHSLTGLVVPLEQSALFCKWRDTGSFMLLNLT